MKHVDTTSPSYIHFLHFKHRTDKNSGLTQLAVTMLTALLILTWLQKDNHHSMKEQNLLNPRKTVIIKLQCYTP
jgi:hypothetical protein